MKRYRLMVFLFSMIQLLGAGQISRAQEPVTPIYSAYHLDNLYWSTDSSTLVFQRRGLFGDEGVVLEDGDYFAYEVRSGSLTFSNRWPLQPALSLE